MLIAGFLPGSPPKPNDSAAKIVKFVTDKNDQLRWAGFVGVLASIVLLGWLGAVWRLLRRAEGGVVRLAVGAALGAAMAAALFNAAGVLMSTVAIVGAPSIGPSATRFFYLLFGGLGAAGGIGLALFVGAASTVIIQTGVLPRALGWFGALIAVVLLVGGGTIASTRDVFFVCGFVGFIGFALWMLIASVLMYRLPSEEREPATVNGVARLAARVSRAGNASGRAPSASVMAFHVAAATAANTASDDCARGRAGVVDDLDVDRRRVLGAQDAERPDGEVVHVAGLGIDGQTLGQHPPQRHVRGADRIGPEHDPVERITGGDAHVDPGDPPGLVALDACARERAARRRDTRCRATPRAREGRRGARRGPLRPRAARPRAAPRVRPGRPPAARLDVGGPVTG